VINHNYDIKLGHRNNVEILTLTKISLYENVGRVVGVDLHLHRVHILVNGISRNIENEAQLMLTNPRDAFRGQSRSLKVVPFYRLGVVSY